MLATSALPSPFIRPRAPRRATAAASRRRRQHPLRRRCVRVLDALPRLVPRVSHPAPPVCTAAGARSAPSVARHPPHPQPRPDTILEADASPWLAAASSVRAHTPPLALHPARTLRAGRLDSTLSTTPANTTLARPLSASARAATPSLCARACLPLALLDVDGLGEQVSIGSRLDKAAMTIYKLSRGPVARSAWSGCMSHAPADKSRDSLCKDPGPARARSRMAARPACQCPDRQLVEARAHTVRSGTN